MTNAEAIEWWLNKAFEWEAVGRQDLADGCLAKASRYEGQDPNYTCNPPKLTLKDLKGFIKSQ